MAGPFAAVLLLATVIDPDLFIHLEITPHRSVFYLSIFDGILAVARGMIPEEKRVFDSEVLVKVIVQYSPYLPDEWREYLHSKTLNLFSEFTAHVDKLGYVCSFAVFHFQRHGNVKVRHIPSFIPAC